MRSTPDLVTSFRGRREKDVGLDTIDTSTASSAFDFLSYSDIDSGQREEFHSLLVKVCLLLFHV